MAYIALIALLVDGVEIPVKSVDVSDKLAVEVNDAMTSTGLPLGHSVGIPEYEISLEIAEGNVGAIVLTMDGVPTELNSLSVREGYGRELVKTMNATGLPTGFARGIESYDADLEVPVDLLGYPWSAVQNGILQVRTPAGLVIQALNGCRTSEIGGKYPGSVASRSVKLVALGGVSYGGFAWRTLEGGVLQVRDPRTGAVLESYSGLFSMESTVRYALDGTVAVRTVRCGALRKLV